MELKTNKKLIETTLTRNQRSSMAKVCMQLACRCTIATHKKLNEYASTAGRLLCTKQNEHFNTFELSVSQSVSIDDGMRVCGCCLCLCECFTSVWVWGSTVLTLDQFMYMSIGSVLVFFFNTYTLRLYKGVTQPVLCHAVVLKQCCIVTQKWMINFACFEQTLRSFIVPVFEPFFSLVKLTIHHLLYELFCLFWFYHYYHSFILRFARLTQTLSSLAC